MLLELFLLVYKIYMGTCIFKYYKKIETGKWTKIIGWDNQKAAKLEISSSYNRFQSKRNI